MTASWEDGTIAFLQADVVWTGVVILKYGICGRYEEGLSIRTLAAVPSAS